MQYQYENADPLDAEELGWTITVATDAEVDASTIVEKIIKSNKNNA